METANMLEQPRKLSLQEAVDSCVVFFNNETLERKYDAFIDERLKKVEHYAGKYTLGDMDEDKLGDFLRKESEALRIVLDQLQIPQEKFLRIVSLLRKLDGSFNREWSMAKVEKVMRTDENFAQRIARLFIHGNEDPVMVEQLPKLYRERLNLKLMSSGSGDETSLRIKLKEQYIGTYTNWKGDLVEDLIKHELDRLNGTYGIAYDCGNTPLIDVSVDWAIPTLTDPYVLLMSSYQETTSSGQTTKASVMMHCYELINRRNIRNHENRVFVNFVDGGGWLARFSDFQRLVDGCHYFLNMANLNMLENIIIKHVPFHYFPHLPPP